MTPKEKAKELANKFLRTGMMIRQAKECALIAVDEILIMLIAIEARAIWQEYYQEVKQEINKI
jgi:hypothetical protein